jgi:hypothetical protein
MMARGFSSRRCRTPVAPCDLGQFCAEIAGFERLSQDNPGSCAPRNSSGFAYLGDEQNWRIRSQRSRAYG